MGTCLSIHKLALILPAFTCSASTSCETKPWLACQNAKGWRVNHDQNHLIRIPILNNLSGAIAWSLISPFLSFHCNCYEYMVGQQFTSQEDFFFISLCSKICFDIICPQFMAVCLYINCFMGVQAICMGILHANTQEPSHVQFHFGGGVPFWSVSPLRSIVWFWFFYVS